MRALIQRVTTASVQVSNEVVSSIDRGFLVLLGIARTDDEREARYLAKKIAGLRIFEDRDGKMNQALADLDPPGAVLVVSQFTLYGNVRKGRRPSFIEAARPERAESLYYRFCELLEAEGPAVFQGVFQAEMQVALINDGPVTLWLDTKELNRKN